MKAAKIAMQKHADLKQRHGERSIMTEKYYGKHLKSSFGDIL